MSPTRRMERLREEIRRELASIIEFEARDPAVKGAFPTIMDEQLSSDARYAKVNVAVSADANRQALLRALNRERGFCRTELARRLALRYTPDLRFVVDEAVDRSLRLEKLLREDAGDLR